jgi:hypothetical protein
MTTRSRSNAKDPVIGDLKRTATPEKIESSISSSDDKAPVNIETESLTEEPVEAPVAVEKQVIETDVRKKLNRKTDDDSNPFVPSNPAQIEADAKRVAAESGFDLNRGTSVGARLMARSQNRTFQ